ncbi:MAG: alcohol dehydrogenase catalytic domain-containing protein [Nitrososphaerota archaeon]
MKAAVLRGPRTIRVEDLPMPKVGVNDVLMRVVACGVCGSDIAYYQRGRADVPPPIILGHEFSGEIVELGETAKKLALFEEGDRVVAEPVMACGACFSCKQGYPNMCERPTVLGVTVNGGMAEYCIVRYDYLHKIPDEVSFEEAAFTEPLACALHGIRKLRISPGMSAAVIGPGPIGLMVVQYLKRSGLSPVILVGTRDYRLEVGLKLGADFAINMREKSSKYYSENPAEKVKELTDGKGVDRVFVATGGIEGNQLAVGIAGARSVVVFFGGAGYDPTSTISIPLWEGTLKEVEFAFSWLSPYTFPEALNVIKRRLVDVKPLITHSFPLEEAAKAIETAEKRLENALKVQIKPS